MGKASHSATYARFAAISFVVVLLGAGGFVFIGAGLVRAHEERAAARSVNGVLADPLRAILDRGGDPGDVRVDLDDVVRPLLGGHLESVRAWSPDGALLYEIGLGPETPAVLPDPPGVAHAQRRTPQGGHLFATYQVTDAYVLEIAQDAGPLESAIREGQVNFAVVVIILALPGYVLLQVGFWLAVRRFEGEYQRLHYLYRTGQEIRGSLDLQEVLTQLSRDATSRARGEHGLIALFEQETGDLLLRATYDHGTREVAHHQRPVEEWFLRRCVATNSTVISDQPGSSYRQIVGGDTELEGQVAVLCVPMALRDRVVGVVAVLRPSARGSFAKGEVELVEELSGQAVTAVEQARLFTKVRTYADELELSYDTTLKVLMAALDTKDEVTEGHCERVARLTVHLAKTMGLPESMLLDMERGALLHDVGKIGVPDAVLKKPASLNHLEWEAMRKHPLLAGLMVSKVGFLEGALPILLYHHERFDGKGYPFGLAREKIPIEARVFSVVDSYDAMTSDRPYRAAMSHDQAMVEIHTHSGTQFDPSVVYAFEQLMELHPDLREHKGHRISLEHEEHSLEVPPDVDAA